MRRSKGIGNRVSLRGNLLPLVYLNGGRNSVTVKLAGRDAIIQALLMLVEDIASGAVVSCSLHYEPTMVARLSVCYVTSDGEVSDLPGIPGAVVSVEDETETLR